MSKQIRTDAETFARLTNPARGMTDAEVLAELDKDAKPTETGKCEECGGAVPVDRGDAGKVYCSVACFDKRLERVDTNKRTEKRAGGRIKRTLVRDPAVGVTFGSKVEAKRYDWLIAQPDVVHVDVHPKITLPGGIRYEFDFLVWGPTFTQNGWAMPGHNAWVEDVKGRKPSTAFERIRKLFNSSHPLAPLRVVVWRRGEWREI